MRELIEKELTSLPEPLQREVYDFARFLPELEKMISGGWVTLESLKVVAYRIGAVVAREGERR